MRLAPALSLLVISLLVSGCAIKTAARSPQPNFIAKTQISATYDLNVSNVPRGEYCSREGGLKDFCVTNFQSAIKSGLRSVLDGFFVGAGDQQYRATFQMKQFSHAAATGYGLDGGPAAEVSVKWQFQLFDPQGQPVIQLAETTKGPDRFASTDAADGALTALLEAVMERIAKEVNDAQIPLK